MADNSSPNNNQPTNNSTIPPATENTRPDWVTARLQGKIPSYSELYRNGMSPENFDFQDAETYWKTPVIQSIFKKQDGTPDREAFQGFYDNEKKQYETSRNTTLDLVNFQEGAFTSLGAKLKTNTPLTAVKDVNPDPLGRAYIQGDYLSPKYGVREAANKRGVRNADGSYTPVSEYSGTTRFAKNADGSFKFDEEGMPFHEPLPNKDMLRSFDESYNKLSDITGQYGFQYNFEDFAWSIPRNLLNFFNSALDSIHEVAKTPLAIVGGENTSLYSGLEDSQNWLRRNRLSSAGEIDEGFFSFKNINDLAQNVLSQLGSMYAVGSSLTKAGSALGVRNPGAFGATGAKLYMTAIASAPLAQVARENGLSERESALMLAATAPLIYKISGLSDAVIRGIDPTKFQSGMKEIFTQAAAQVKGKQPSAGSLRSLTSMFSAGGGALVYNLSKTPVVRGAALEGLEEVAEQAVDLGAREVWNHGFSREGASFNIDLINEAKQLGLSFAGGAIGGAIADPLLRRLSGHAPSIVVPLHEAVLDGKEAKLLEFIDKMEKQNRLDAAWLNLDNQPTNNASESRNKATAEIYRGMINRLVELRDSYNLKQTVPNNERRAGALKSALAFSDLGTEIRKIHNTVMTLERDIQEKKMTDQELKLRQQELEQAKEQLAGIQSGEFVNDYIAQGTFNLLAVKGDIKEPSISGAQYVSLMNSLPVSHAIENERAKLVNDQLKAIDDGATPDNYAGVSAAGKNRLLSEISTSLKEVADTLTLQEAGIKAIAPGFSVKQLTSSDPNEVYEAALSLEDAVNGGYNAPAQEEAPLGENEIDENTAYQSSLLAGLQNSERIGTEPELQKFISQLGLNNDTPLNELQEAGKKFQEGKTVRKKSVQPATVDLAQIAELGKKFHAISSHKEAEPYQAGEIEEQVLNMVDKVTGILGERLISSHIPIEEKLRQEKQLEKDMTKNGVSLYNNVNEARNILTSVRQRKTQVEAASQVQVVTNPIREKAELAPLPDFIGKADKILKKLNDMEQEAMRLLVTASVNTQNAEALAALATVKSLEKRLNTLEDIVDILSSTDAASVADYIANSAPVLYSAVEKKDSIAFLKQLVEIEDTLYDRFRDKAASILPMFERPSGPVYDNTTKEMTAPALKITKAYEYLRSVLGTKTSDIWNAYNLAYRSSAESSVVPTVEQEMVAIDAVRHALAGKYDNPIFDASTGATVHSYAAGIDGAPGTGKTSVTIPLIAGIMQKMRPGKTLVTAFKDKTDSKRQRVNNAVREFYKGEKVINVQLKDYSGSLLDFIKDTAQNKDVTSVIFDEATLLTLQELRAIAPELEKLNNIRSKQGLSPLYVFYTFDSAQNSYQHKYSSLDKDRVLGIAHNSTQVIPRTERLSYSHRSMNHSLKVLEDYLYNAQSMSGIGNNITLAHRGDNGVNVISSEDRFFNELRSLIKDKANLANVALITDIEPVQLPSDIVTSGVKILTPETAQGDEWNSVALILKEKNIFDETSLNAYVKRAYYTGATRAKKYLVLHQPATSPVSSSEGPPAEITPISQKGKRDEKIQSFDTILGDKASQQIVPANYTIVDGDQLFESAPENVSESVEAKKLVARPSNEDTGKTEEAEVEDKVEVEPEQHNIEDYDINHAGVTGDIGMGLPGYIASQPQTPGVEPAQTTEEGAKVAQFFTMVNQGKPVTKLFTFFTDAQGGFGDLLELKKKLLFNPSSRKDIPFFVTVAPIGSPDYANVVMNNPSYNGELGVFLEAHYGDKKVIIGTFPDPGKQISTLIAQSGIMQNRAAIRIPVPDTIINQTISRFPEKMRDEKSITPYDQFLSQRVAQGINVSTPFIVTENAEINGMKYLSGDTYVATSLFYSPEEMQSRIRDGQDVLSDPYITTIKLTPRSVSKDEAVKMLTKYVVRDESKRSQLPSTGDVGKMYNSLWKNKFRSQTRRDTYKKQAEAFYNSAPQATKDLMTKRGYLESPDFILSNYIERKATGNIDMLPAFEDMFKKIPVLAEAINSMRIESVKQRNAAKGILAFVDTFENEPLNKVRYSVHGVRELTYPIIGINTDAMNTELAKAVSQPSIAETTKSESIQTQGPVRENSPALVTTADTVRQEFQALANSNASITEIFQTLFAGPRHVWFIPMTQRFRREVWNNLFVLTGDQPLMRNINTAITEAKNAFAKRVAAYPLPEEIASEHKDVYIDHVIYKHFDDLLKHYYPVVKFSDEFNQYHYESKHVKDSGFYDRDQFSQIEDGMTEMVKSHLYNTPIVEELPGGHLRTTGRYLNESSIEDLLSYTRGLRSVEQVAARLSRETDPLARSLYIRFFSPNPTIVDGTKTHSLYSLVGNEDVFHMLSTVTSAITSSELFPISHIDITENRMNIPVSLFKPTHAAQVGLEGILSVSENSTIEKTPTGIAIDGAAFPTNKEYTETEVVSAMRKLGLGYFSPAVIEEVEKSVEVLRKKKGSARKDTLKWLMDKVFFPVATKIQTEVDNPSTFYSDALDKVFQAIKKTAGVKENIYDINLDGERSPRVRRTAPIFTIKTRIDEIKTTNSLATGNLFVKENPTYELSESGFFVKQGVRSVNRGGFERIKSNSRMSAGELLETDLLWGFANTVDKHENIAAFPIMVYSDASTDIVPLIKSNKDFFRGGRVIAQELFNSRSRYYQKLERELLTAWAPYTRATSLAELQSRLKAKKVPIADIEKSPMVKNLFYINDGKGNAVLKQRLVDEAEFYKQLNNVQTFYDRLDSRYKELLEAVKQEPGLYEKLQHRKHSPEQYVSAFYFNWVAVSSELTNLLAGSQFQYNGDSDTKEYINMVKRGKLKISNRSAQVLRDNSWNASYLAFKRDNPGAPLPSHLLYEGLRLNRFAKVAYVKDIEIPLINYSNGTQVGQKVYDGASFVTPLTRVFQFYSNGGPHGVFMGPAAKNITSEYNYTTGSNTEVKNAEFEITPEMMMNGSELMLSVVRRMLSVPFNKAGLQEQNALEVLHKVIGVPEDFSVVSRQDFDKLAKWLVENDVQDIPILEVIPDTAAKTGNHTINSFMDEQFTPAVLDQFSKGSQLDATKDPFEGLNTKVLTQMVNALSINWANPEDLQAFYGSLARIAEETATRTQETPLEDTEASLRATLRDAVLSREMMTLVSELVRHPNFSLQDRHVINSFVSNLNARLSDEGIAFNFGGGQYILYPSSGMMQVYDVYDKDQKRNITVLKSQLNGRTTIKGEPAVARDLKWVDPVRVSDNKPLSSLYREGVNIKDIKQSLQTDEWTHGYAEVILPGEMRDAFMLQQAFDENRAVDDIDVKYFQQQLSALAENDPRRKMRDSERMAELMYNEFRRRVEGSISRIPTTGKHSGVTTKIVGFVNDTMNGVFVPAELLMVQGADQDIDKGSYVTKKDILHAFKEAGLYTGREKAIAPIGFFAPIANPDFSLPAEYDDILRGLSKEEKAIVNNLAVQNLVSQKLSDILSNPKNTIEQNTTVGDALKKLQVLRDKINEESEKQTPFSIDSYLSYAKLHEMNQAGGKNLIAVFANGQKAYQVLYIAARMTGRQQNLPEGIYGNDNQIWLRYASFINAATDNGNEQILGPMGIDESNASFVNYFISRGWDEDKIYAFLKENADYFKVVRSYRRFDATKGFNPEKAALWRENPKMISLHYRVQEYNQLSQLLLNREIPNSLYESFAYKNNIEKFVNDAYKYHDSITNNPVKKLPLDFLRFIEDDAYAQGQIDQYETMIAFDGKSYTGRHAYNVLDALRNAPHIRAYQKVYAASRRILEQYPIISLTDSIAAEARNVETIRSISDDMYRTIMDFTYGLAIDNYFKVRDKMVGDVNLASPVGRTQFVDKMHKNVEGWKNIYKGNKFIEALVLSDEKRNKQEFKRLRLFDSNNLTEEAVLELKAAFTMLPANYRQAFFYYSLIADRDLPSKGSISTFVDLADKIDFNQFLQNELKREDIAVEGMDFVRHRERTIVNKGRFRNYRLPANTIPFEILPENEQDKEDLQIGENSDRNPVISREHLSLVREVIAATVPAANIEEGPSWIQLPSDIGYFSKEQSSQRTIAQMVNSILESPDLFTKEQVTQLKQMDEYYKRAAEQLTEEDTVKKGKACGLFNVDLAPF